MKILLTSKLSNSKLEGKLLPLIKSNNIHKIYVVRDFKGPALPKVAYYEVPLFFHKPAVLKTIIKLFLLTYLSVSKRADVIYGIHLLYHGITAFTAAKLTGKKSMMSIIAGETETKLHGRIMEKVYLKLLNKFTIITVTGSKTRNYLIKKGVNPRKVEVIPNAINFKEINPAKKTAKEYDIITHGRLSKDKNIKTFIRTLAILKLKKPSIKAVIVGDGPEKSNLIKLAKKLNLEKNITFTGHQTDVNSFLNKSKIWVLTSKHEGFPTALIEAMMFGLACVVSDVGDISDFAHNNHNALITSNCCSADNYAHLISSLIENKRLYSKISKNAQKIIQEYNLNKVNSEWDKLLKRIKCEEPKKCAVYAVY